MYSRILVSLDGSKLAEKALPHAEGLAKTTGATIHLITVFSRHPREGNPTGAGLESDRSVDEALEMRRQFEESQIQQTEEYLLRIATRLNNDGISTETEIHEGAPYEHIVDYAKQHGVDLIVMASHGHGGLKRMLLGSTTDRVIRAGEVPVLVVP